MFRLTVTLLALLYVSPSPLLRGAQDTATEKKRELKKLLDVWQAAYFEGLKVGHVHALAQEVMRHGKKVIRTDRQMNLVLKRYGSVVPIRIDETSLETADGKVLSLATTQYLAGDEKRTSTGVVKDGKLTYTAPDGTEQTLEWDDDAVGPYWQEMVFQKKNVKTGDKFKFLDYQLMLPGALTVQVAIKENDNVDRLFQKTEGKVTTIVREPVSLLRVEAVPDKFVVGGTPVQLPTKTVWLDAKFLPVREQFQMPGMGAITLYNTTKEAALKEGVAPELLPDLGLKISIPVKVTIESPYDTSEAVYRITLKDDVAKVFAEDARQKILDKKDNSFELAVKAIRRPVKVENPIKPGSEYLQSNQFIDSDNARIKATAEKIVDEETDPWKKALMLERWVHDNMRMSTSVGFPTAGQICRNMEGDCRQHAILLAALCRAAGIPARTAIGLIYAREKGRSPYFGFHMWTEVAVKGQWLGLDAILGEGGIGATHLKMGDHSWSKTATLAPLLPVSQALGKVAIEVMRAK
jgi:transglutaminase-like putative cysteine protease